MEVSFRLLVGIDWATEAHQICVIDCDRQVLRELSVKATGTGLSKLVEVLNELSGGDPANTAVAIEVPRGPIVETLLERGFVVFAINPKQLDRFRDRHSVAGAKDDRRDAFVLADSLRTDRHLFRRVETDDPVIIQLRELSRMDDDLASEMTRLTHRLRSLLQRYYPQVLSLGSVAEDRWLWALLELAPTPEQARRLRPKRIEKLLAAHRIRRLQTSEVLAALRSEPLTVVPGTIDATRTHLQLLLPRLRLAHQQRKECAKRIDKLLDELQLTEGEDGEHRDVEILRSLPGVGRLVAATLLSEATRALVERDYHVLRALCGAAPVTRQSGKYTRVAMRYACSGRLKNAIYYWAGSSVRSDPFSKLQYARFRAKGHTHARALRGVADRLLRILVAMLTTRSLYDPLKPHQRQTIAQPASI